MYYAVIEYYEVISLGYKIDPDSLLTDAEQRILDALAQFGSASPHQIWESSSIAVGKVMIQRHLKNLIAKGYVRKIGTAPHVFYMPVPRVLGRSHQWDLITSFLVPEVQQQILVRYFGLDADFTLYRGEGAFKQWFYQKQLPALVKQKSTKLTLDEHIRANFFKLLQTFIDLRGGIANATDRQLELIDATERYRSIHHSDVIERVFYLDFYALPQFGKSLLGFIVQKAKVGEVSSLPYIEEIAGLLQSYLPRLIKTYGCDACAWVPHTIRRTHSLQDILQKKVDLDLKKIAIVKVVAGDVVPQKSLSELAQRLDNAATTNHIGESWATLQKVHRLLLIDDAIGSNATMHAIASKIKVINPAITIIAFAPVGSFKGFDVIRDI